MINVVKKLYQSVINPPTDDALNMAWEQSRNLLPVLWLLGKTGSGKSTIVQKLTGENKAEVGNGFRPCTKSSAYYDYPSDQPILRFLDTRGLGEASYDPAEDIRFIANNSHAVVIVLRVSDSEQHEVISALKLIRKEMKNLQSSHVLVVHTCLSQIAGSENRERARQHNQAQIENAWGHALDSCAVELMAESAENVDKATDELKKYLSGKIPAIRLWLLKRSHADAEHENFERFRSEILWYAGVAAASDAVPMVGLVSVPGIQGKMLHSLAQRYGIVWNKRSFFEFIGALGFGFGTRYIASLANRQVVKLIPFYGQSAGAVVAASISYSGTYALGRAACSYLYHKKTDKPFEKISIKNLYRQAILDGTKKTGKKDRN